MIPPRLASRQSRIAWPLTSGLLAALTACTPATPPTEVRGNLVLTSADDVARAAEVRHIHGDLIVEAADVHSVDLPRLTSIDGAVYVWENATLEDLSWPSLTTIGGDLSVYDNPVLDSLSGVASLRSVGGVVRINRMPALVDLPWDEVDALGGLYLYDDALLAEVSFGALARIDGDVDLWSLPSLIEARFPVLEEVRGGLDLFDNDALTTLDFPQLVFLQSYELHHCDAMQSPGDFPRLDTLPRHLTLQYNDALDHLGGLATLDQVDEAVIRFNPALKHFGGWPLERVAATLTVANNRSLVTLDLPELDLAPTLEVRGHPRLTTVTLPALEGADQVRVVDNSQWATCDIEALLDRLEPLRVLCSGNGPDTCMEWCSGEG